ncbi:sulfatase-like hydrolase/transferase [Calycomorphotria hydatis]|uniref:Arylsulfatase n=1 Tax=Calycomorphotria hydatis TaxID=2528027 RepID=A0A517TCG8_9PLAN|nr:sulfatase-like hydrolase/transferase [Calycomorphotria hydatis]QDT66074.1 Arylsulfatase precursor [Calycomorphotria hydatis]
MLDFFVRIAFAVALGSFFCADTFADEHQSRPNFVVILCDDLGYGDLGCYGHPHIKTPNLDQLADQGIRMTSCYSSAPVCSSSRAGLLTGKNPSRIGVYDWIPENHVMHMRAEEVTVAQRLSEGGYETAMVGKWHCNGYFNSPKQPQPNDHGFDYWFATQNNAKPRHENPINFVRNGDEVGPLEGFSCQLVADEAINWLTETRDKTKPFYLHVCFHEPHEPVESPDKLVEEYMGVAKNKDEAQYFANVANMDRAVGRLVQSLDAQGLGENTLIFFTSDNGPETLNRYRGSYRSYGSPGPLRGMKLHIYEGGIRVAGILRWTGEIAEGQTSDQPICGYDVLPTFCELAHVKPNVPGLDGESFAPLLSGKSLNREKPFFWHYYRAISDPRVAIRDGEWKMVAMWDGPKPSETRKVLGNNINQQSQEILKTAKLVDFELYRIADDIGERNEVSEKYPDVAAKMKQQLLSRYRGMQAESPTWDFD